MRFTTIFIFSVKSFNSNIFGRISLVPDKRKLIYKCLVVLSAYWINKFITYISLLNHSKYGEINILFYLTEFLPDFKFIMHYIKYLKLHLHVYWNSLFFATYTFIRFPRILGTLEYIQKVRTFHNELKPTLKNALIFVPLHF